VAAGRRHADLGRHFLVVFEVAEPPRGPNSPVVASTTGSRCTRKSRVSFEAVTPSWLRFVLTEPV
jgi:hypothetical protein